MRVSFYLQSGQFIQIDSNWCGPIDGIGKYDSGLSICVEMPINLSRCTEYSYGSFNNFIVQWLHNFTTFEIHYSAFHSGK